MAIEKVDVPINNGDFPYFFVCLPEANNYIATPKEETGKAGIMRWFFFLFHSMGKLSKESCLGLVLDVKSMAMAISGTDWLEVPTIYKAFF